MHWGCAQCPSVVNSQPDLANEKKAMSTPAINVQISMVKRLSYENRERQQRKGVLHAKYVGYSAWAVAPFLNFFLFFIFPITHLT